MANQEHLKILKQGVEVWNRWREKNSKVLPDLTGADISCVKLNCTEFIIADIRGANLRNTKFICANLSGADLSGADLSGADLSGADLSGADLSGAILIEAEFIEADLSKAVLIEAVLSKADLREVKLNEANLREAKLKGANLREAKLKGANLSGANLSGADLSRTYLAKANISGAILAFTLRDYWEIKNIQCDYVYWDLHGQERTPKNRNFELGEFEEIYEWKPLNDFEKIIKRSIKFPEEYKQAGTFILNYFSEILRKKYPYSNATVQIIQEGLKVSMIIDPVDGNKEVIERALDDYGLIITGKITPEEYTNDKLLIMDLKSHLNFAKAQIENLKMMLEFQNEELKKKDIRIDRFLSLMECAISRDVNVNLNMEQNHGANIIKKCKVGVVGDDAEIQDGVNFEE